MRLSLWVERACRSLHMHFFRSNDTLAQQTFEFAHCVQYSHVNLSSFWGLGTLQIPSSLFLPFLPHFSLWKWKVYDTSNTHPQPWPSSTLPQSSTTLLIICLSQFCLLVRLSNWCPLPNLTGNYIGIRGASSLNPPFFSALLFYGPLLLARSFGSTTSCNSVSDLCLFYNSVKTVTFHGIRRRTVRSELWPLKLEQWLQQFC